MAAKRKRTFLRCPIEALKLLDVDAAEVQDVILSHLHYDHVGNFHRFPKARFHLQEPEIHYATGHYMGYPKLSHSFEVEDICGIVRLNFARRVQFHFGSGEASHRASRSTPSAVIRPACSSCASIPAAAGSWWRRTSRISTRIWKPEGRS